MDLKHFANAHIKPSRSRLNNYDNRVCARERIRSTWTQSWHLEIDGMYTRNYKRMQLLLQMKNKHG